MSLRDKVKAKSKNKLKKIVFAVIKPFLPFIIAIIGIIFAISTVADALFVTDYDMEFIEQISHENYEEQYAKWIKEKEETPTSIIGGNSFIPKRNVYLAHSWIY